jgi:hypothetical protein
VLARQLQRFPTILCLQCVVALRFQKIVKELHIQLIVFDDENGFRHYGRVPDRVLQAFYRSTWGVGYNTKTAIGSVRIENG